VKQRDDNEQILVRYLLGEMGEDEQEQVEEMYFGDEEFFDRLLIVEDELIDAYARQKLSELERERFENYFLRSPERRERVEFAKAWVELFSRTPESDRDKKPSLLPRPYIGFSRLKQAAFFIPLAAAILLLFGLTWLFLQNGKLRSALEQAQAASVELERKELDLEQQMAEQRARNEEVVQELANERSASNQQSPENQAPEKQSPKIASFVLTAGLTRGAGSVNAVAIPKGSDTVKLETYFRQGDYKEYRTAIRTAEGAEVWSQPKLRAQSKGPIKTIALKLPANLLHSGEYILTVSGVNSREENEIINEYPFKVLKK
jgi:cell division protein FtsB